VGPRVAANYATVSPAFQRQGYTPFVVQAAEQALDLCCTLLRIAFTNRGLGAFVVLANFWATVARRGSSGGGQLRNSIACLSTAGIHSFRSSSRRASPRPVLYSAPNCFPVSIPLTISSRLSLCGSAYSLLALRVCSHRSFPVARVLVARSFPVAKP
jgi:hypothetical protein